MTGARRQRKSRCVSALFGALLAGLGTLPGAPAPAATTELIVSDPNSGLAINGFDPVAYFTDAKPKLGRPEYELRFGGVVWRFANEGNLAAFVARPDIFMPRFGGYDPISVARGASAPGHPELWLVADERLYLFYSEAARSAFVSAPAPAIDAAERLWPAVVRKLAP